MPLSGNYQRFIITQIFYKQNRCQGKQTPPDNRQVKSIGEKNIELDSVEAFKPPFKTSKPYKA